MKEGEILKKIVGVVSIFMSVISLSGCTKKDEGYDPFGSTAEQHAKAATPESSSTAESSHSDEREMFISISTEFEADTDKMVTITGETLPGSKVTFWDREIKETAADSKGKFSFVKNFISISDQSFKISSELNNKEESKEITLKPNKEYLESLKNNVEKSKENTSDIPSEYVSAANKAKSYSDTMHMSKAGIYDQLISQHGEKFSPGAAQYAIDNISVDYNANALKKAKDYRDTMNMSPDAIREQLISENGEKFTVDEANYAIQNLK